MTATRKPRQTAGNNKFLANVKRMMNTKVYAVILGTINSTEFGDGEDEARNVLSLYFRDGRAYVDANF